MSRCCLSWAAFAATIACAAAAFGPQAFGAVEVQTFDSEEAAATAGWTLVNGTLDGSDFGWKDTGMAGGNSMGEAGGAFKRPTALSYYADTNLNGAYTVGDSLVASGKIYAEPGTTDISVNICFFDRTRPVDGAVNADNYIGFKIDNGNVSASACGGDYGGYNEEGGNANMPKTRSLPTGVAYEFTMVYTPDPFGTGLPAPNPGQLTVTFVPLGGTSETIVRCALASGQDRSNRLFNTFGLVIANSSTDGGTPRMVYVDDLSYTGERSSLASINSFVVTDQTSGSSVATDEATVDVSIIATPGPDATIEGYQITETDDEPVDGWLPAISTYDIQAAPGAMVTLYAWVKDTSGGIATKSATIYYGPSMVEVQNFDSEADADAAGWTLFNGDLDGSDIGWKDSSNAGGDPGEAGGAFKRVTSLSYYADTTLGRDFTVGDYLTASGKIYINTGTTDASVLVCFFDPLTVGGGGSEPHMDNIIGFKVDNTTIMASACGGDWGGYTPAGTNAGNTKAGNLAAGTVYNFVMTYTPDPLGTGLPAPNPGELVIKFTPATGGPATTFYGALASGQDRSNRKFSAFGMVNANSTTDSGTPKIVYLDNLVYTSEEIRGAGIEDFIASDVSSGSSLYTNEAAVDIYLAGIPSPGAEVVGYQVTESATPPTEGWLAWVETYTIQAAPGGDVTLYGWVKDSAGSVAGEPFTILYTTAAPVASNVAVTAGALPGTAVVTWTTDIPAVGSVNYGPAALSGATPDSAMQDVLATDHSVTITDLADGTNYKIVPLSNEVPSAAVYWPDAWPIPGDSTFDCRVNILDLIFIRNKLNLDVATGDNWKADVNKDGRVNILDLIAVRNKLNTQCP